MKATIAAGRGFSRTPLDRVAALFGEDFARRAAQAAAGVGSDRCDRPMGCTWSWSQRSKPATLPPFEEVRPAVEREWFAERRAATQAAQYQALLAGYQVIVQMRAATTP